MSNQEEHRYYVFGPYRLDTSRRLLLGPDGQPIALKPRVFETLLCLVEHAGELLDKDTLMHTVWPGAVVEENNLNQHISALRRVLGERPGENRFIVTVPGRGYRFVAEVHRVAERDGHAEAMPESAQPPASVTAETAHSPDRDTSRTSHRARARPRRYLPASLASVALLSTALWYLVWPSGPQYAPSPSSVAVLPFDNLSPNPEHVFFASGIHEELLNRLAKLQSLEVTSRTSVLRYADGELSVPEIGRELGVAAVLEGSVRYADGRVRITAQLIDARTDRHLWSEIYERDFADIFEIQSDIAVNIARALEAELGPIDRRSLEESRDASADAHRNYLEANGLLLTRTGAGIMERAELLLDRALEIDPGFARAYGLKARIHAQRLINTVFAPAVAPEHRPRVVREIRQYVARALELDPADHHALGALRLVDMLSWQWAGFDQPMEPATEPELHELWMLSWLGRHSQALRRAERLAELNPHAVNAYFSLGVVQAYAGDHLSSIANVGRALELAPGNALGRAWLAYNAVALGDRDAALADLRLVERLLGENRPLAFLPELAYAYARIGHEEDARRIFDEIRAIGSEIDVGAGTWATAYLAIGDASQALHWLEVAAEKARNRETDPGFYSLMNLRMRVLGDPLLEEPPFADVLSRIRGS